MAAINLRERWDDSVNTDGVGDITLFVPSSAGVLQTAAGVQGVRVKGTHVHCGWDG